MEPIDPLKPEDEIARVPACLLEDPDTRAFYERRQVALKQWLPEYDRIRAEPDKTPTPEDVVVLMNLCEMYCLDWSVGLAPTGSPNERTATEWRQSPVDGSKPVCREFRVEEAVIDGKLVLLPYSKGWWKRLIIAMLDPILGRA